MKYEYDDILQNGTFTVASTGDIARQFIQSPIMTSAGF